MFEGDKLVKLEYDVKLVKSDVNRNFIMLKVNGEEVIVEKFTEDEWREWKEREKKESPFLIRLDKYYFLLQGELGP
ncbi:MAG: hypothetical protein HA496_06395 [Thaumarchaeota archaeon]|nr:hypothetical protein [Nitrososphaerota archaeon]